MNLNWNRRVRLDDQNFVLHTKNSTRPARVTIGMPTFKRAHTIRRALSSLARQTFRDFVVVISDNAGVDSSTIEAVRSMESDLPEVCLVAQVTNIGALANLNFLLACASTEYFMWLADDDEISDNYLEKLVGLLDGDPTAVSAMGCWRKMHNDREGHDRPQLDKSAKSRAVRVFRYIAFETDDSLFYGLHRTDQLRQCQFSDYFYPNTGVLTNWCYVFLFDMIWQGRIRSSREAAWISHGYTEKSYSRALAGGIRNKAQTLVRRMNVYVLYCAKTARSNPVMLLVSVPASVIGFVRDLVTALGRVGVRRTAGSDA